MTDLPVWWIRSHWQSAGMPAVAMLRNGFEQTFPCNARVRPTFAQQVKSFEDFVTFMAAVKTFVGFFAL
jgi:hypothetical protein